MTRDRKLQKETDMFSRISWRYETISHGLGLCYVK